VSVKLGEDQTSSIVGSDDTELYLNLREIKVRLEKYLQIKHKSKLNYSGDHSNFISYVYENKSNCSSGSDLLIIIHRLISKNVENFKKSRIMAVIQEGHILLGQIKGPNQKARLISYETTTIGSSEQDLGLMSNLHLRSIKLSLPIETDFYMADIIETDKNKKQNLIHTAYQRLKVLYGVQVERIFKIINQENSGSFLAFFNKQIYKIKKFLGLTKKTSSFAFGKTPKVTNAEKSENNNFIADDTRYELFKHINELYKQNYIERYDFPSFTYEQTLEKDLDGNNALLYLFKEQSNHNEIVVQ
jgi:hypothetical protein